MHYWDKLAKTNRDYRSVPRLMRARRMDGTGSGNGIPDGTGAGSFYTGKGADGVLQPDRPAAIDYSSGKPIVIHEGESVSETPRGRFVTPAKMVSLNSAQEQDDAAEMEREYGLKGLAAGGLTGADPQALYGTKKESSTIIPTGGNLPNSTVNPLTKGGVNTLGSERKGNIAPNNPNPLAGTAIGMNTLQGIATGETDLYKGVYDKINNQQLGRLGASHSAEKAAQAQNAAQTGMSQAQQNVLGSVQDRNQSLERGAVSQTLGMQQQQQQAQAQGTAIREVIQGKKEAIADLIKLGGVDNLAQAESYAKDVYGTGVYGLGDIANDQKMSAIAKYTAIPGMTISGAMDMLKNNGDLERYGISEDEATDIASKLILGSDPIYQAQSHYGDLLNNGLISNDEYTDAVDFVKWGQMNPDGVEIVDSYRVFDADKNEVGNFKTQEEADLFMQQNEGSYNVEKVPNGYIGYKGDYDEYFGDYLQGDVFTGTDGGLYMNIDGQKVLARPTPEDPFSSQNTKLLNYLEANGMDNDMAREIRRQQLGEVITAPEKMPLGIASSDSLYKDLSNKSRDVDVPRVGERDDVSEQGHGHDSEKILNSLHDLPDNTWVNLGGKLYLYQGKTKQIENGQDDTNEYHLINPVDGEKINYKTTTDGKLESSRVAGKQYGGGVAEKIMQGFLLGAGSVASSGQ